MPKQYTAILSISHILLLLLLVQIVSKTHKSNIIISGVIKMYQVDYHIYYFLGGRIVPLLIGIVGLLEMGREMGRDTQQRSSESCLDH